MEFTRRSFIRNSLISVPGVAIGGMPITKEENNTQSSSRQIWVGTISQEGIKAESPKEMCEKIMPLLEEMIPLNPDIICLPEAFSTLGQGDNKDKLKKVAEERPYSILDQFKEYAKNHSCYIICPIITQENGRCYNTAVLINRKGELQDEYKKLHISIGEMDKGIYPGASPAKAWQTDFGKIGVQICFDIQWHDGWQSLIDQQAEIIFWTSAFSGGALLQAKAWECKSYMVSSVNKGAARILDLTGNEIVSTGVWNKNWICAPLNLEKKVVYTWPHIKKFSEIEKEYGRKIRITNYHEEEWSVFESLHPDVKIKNVLKKYDIPDFAVYIKMSEEYQKDFCD